MLKIYDDLIQGSDEWLAARCGLLTASEMKLLVTPTLKTASNDKERAHLYEMVAQRCTGFVEPQYVSDAMLRGQEDEIFAKIEYAKHWEPVTEVGFITNDLWGFTLGCSPDGLVGAEGGIEIKSRGQKYQMQTIINQSCPDDYMIQIQTCLLVTQRKWWDFISYCAGMPMFVCRVFPDEAIQTAIVDAAQKFEDKAALAVARYHELAADPAYKLIPTKRRVELEITL